MQIKMITESEEKCLIAREILKDLPEWFGIPAATEAYIQESKEQVFAAAFAGEASAGFMTMKETSPFTAEIAVCGVKKRFHRQGAGSAMFAEIKSYARQQGYEYLQVKTVAAGCYPEYDATRMFYENLGFRALEVFPTLWDERNPCLVMVMRL